MWRYSSRSAAIVAALFITACGGGSDGGGGGAVTPPPAGPTFVQISLTNQDTVARAAVASILPFTSVSSVGVTPNPTANTAAKANAGAYRERGILTHLTRKGVNLGVGRDVAARSNMARALAAYSSTDVCQISGTVTVTWDDRDNSATFTAGDVMTMSFVQCSDWVNSSINGVMTFSFSSIAMTPTTFDAAGSITLQQLVLIDQATSFSMDGGFSFTLNETSVINGVKDIASYTVGSAGLTVANSGSAVGYTDAFTYRAGYTVTEEDFVPNVAGVPATSVITANGNFKSNALNGDLSLTTVQPLRLTQPDENPSEGQLAVNGLNNTKLGMTAVSSSQVRMDVCDDGDGVWEGTKTVAWSSVIQ